LLDVSQTSDGLALVRDLAVLLGALEILTRADSVPFDMRFPRFGRSGRFRPTTTALFYPQVFGRIIHAQLPATHPSALPSHQPCRHPLQTTFPRTSYDRPPISALLLALAPPIDLSQSSFSAPSHPTTAPSETAQSLADSPTPSPFPPPTSTNSPHATSPPSPSFPFPLWPRYHSACTFLDSDDNL